MNWHSLFALFIFHLTTGYSQDIPHHFFTEDFAVGSLGDDNLEGALYLSDSTFLLYGQSRGEASFDKSEGPIGEHDYPRYDYWVLKIDNHGDVLWENTIGGTQRDWISTAIEISEKKILLVGYSSSPVGFDMSDDVIENSSDDFWVVCIDSNGLLLWDNAYEGDDVDQATSILKVSDNNFIIGGSSCSNSSEDKSEDALWDPLPSSCILDYWLLSIDTLGNLLWDETIGGKHYDELEKIINGIDGGLILAGSSDSQLSFNKSEDRHGGYDYWIVKTDTLGNVLWDVTLGGTKNDLLKDIIVLSDSTYLLVGNSKSDASYDKTEDSYGYEDYWIVKMDTLGNVIWDKTYGGELGDYALIGLQTSDSVIIVAGHSASDTSLIKDQPNYGDFDIWLLFLDMAGNLLHQDAIGCEGNEIINDVIKIGDSLYLFGSSSSNICSYKSQNNLGGDDYWFGHLNNDLSQSMYGYAVCEGDSILLPTGEFAYSPGIYVDTIVGDMFDTVIYYFVDTSFISTNFDTYWGYWYPYVEEGVTYSWYNCTTGEIAPDESGTLIPEVGYEYALIASKPGCTDTSDCILAVGVSDKNLASTRVFPNPSVGQFEIQIPDVEPVLDFLLFDPLGKSIPVKYSIIENGLIGRTEGLHGLYYGLIYTESSILSVTISFY